MTICSRDDVLSVNVTGILDLFTEIMDAPAEQIETILTEKEAAKFLKISRMTLFRNRRDKTIGFYKVGKQRITYSLEKHLQPFLESCNRPIAEK